MHAYIGIDPGIKGAAVLIAKDGRFIIHDWQDEERARQTLYGWFQQFNCEAAIERVFNINVKQKKEGDHHQYFGNLKLAINFGVWRGLMTAIGIDYVEPAPRTWQCAVMIKSAGNTTKERSFNTVRELFPGTCKYIKSPTRDNGRADAFLIAYWLKRKLEFEQKLKNGRG
jgi:hypothetical protein